MLDEMGKKIDAVTVSTPDHTHAPASAMAMRMGKACFTQKPLTHTIYEARMLGEIAREMKVATQMGNQGTAGNSLRKTAAVVKLGACSATSRKSTSGPTARSGRRAATVPAEAPVPGERPLGPVARPRARIARTPPAITRSPGAAGGTSAPAPWATWPATRSTCRSWPSNLRDPTSVQAETSGHNKRQLPEVVDHHLRVPGQRATAPAVQDDLVRRRQEAVDRLCSTAKQVSEHRRAADRRQGQAVRPGRLLREGLQAARRRDRHRRSSSTQSPGHFARVRPRHQGRPAGDRRTSPTTPAR